MLWEFYDKGLFGLAWEAYFVGLPCMIIGVRLLSKKHPCPSCTPDITPKQL